MKTTRFNIIDLETTGFDPPEAEVIEIAVTQMAMQHTGNPADEPTFTAANPVSYLCGLAGNLTPESRAVHHITPGEIKDFAPCGTKLLRETSLLRNPDFLVAHNAEFERKWFTEAVTGGKPWICTYKAALRVWPGCPSHSNSCLRYWLEDQGKIPDLGRRGQPAHRAAPDTVVTTYLLRELLRLVDVAELAQWALEPKLYPFVPFGKHKGKGWNDVDAGYLSWIMKEPDMEPDMKFCAGRELERRTTKLSAKVTKGEKNV
jgi:exodeoxyribonuclease X